MDPIDLYNQLPDLSSGPPTDAMRLTAVEALVGYLNQHLSTRPVAPTPLEDYSLRHLAKATGTARSAVMLMRDRCGIDAGILIRAVFEQLFVYLWVVQDAERAEARSVMVTLKQEWANAKYLEGLAVNAAPEAQARLLEEALSYKDIANTLLAQLAAELGTTEKKVRDEATLRVSAKANEVNVDPAFSIPYAHYSGFAHSDGNALAAYSDGETYSIRGMPHARVPLAGDLHRVLLRLTAEVKTRCPHAAWEKADAYLASHAAWLAEADKKEGGA